MIIDTEYIHYQESITSLNRSWRTLCELEASESGNAIWSAAYRMALIEYCKPFKVSYGKNRERLSLATPDLDHDDLALHEKILSLRDQVLAHSDLSVLDASVCYDRNALFPVPLIVSNAFVELPEVTDIKNLVELVLDVLYSKQGEYEQLYAENIEKI